MFAVVFLSGRAGTPALGGAWVEVAVGRAA